MDNFRQNSAYMNSYWDIWKFFIWENHPKHCRTCSNSGFYQLDADSNASFIITKTKCPCRFPNCSFFNLFCHHPTPPLPPSLLNIFILVVFPQWNFNSIDMLYFLHTKVWIFLHHMITFLPLRVKIFPIKNVCLKRTRTLPIENHSSCWKSEYSVVPGSSLGCLLGSSDQ